MGGSPIAGWFIMFIEHILKIDEDWGNPHFRKPPQVIISGLSAHGLNPLFSAGGSFKWDRAKNLCPPLL